MASWAMGEDTVPPCREGTDLRGSPRTVLPLRRGGRARWQRDHETCHPLHKQGSPGEPKDGKGTPHRSVVCALVRRRALVVDQPPPLGWAFWRAVWAKRGRQRRVWERRRAVGSAYRLDARHAWVVALL